MNERVKVSTPGKLMLLGEHAVVYDRPCLVTAVGQRMHATVEVIDGNKFQLEAPDVKISGYEKKLSELGRGDIPKGAKFVEIAVANFADRYPLKGGLRISTSSEFSSLFGFGSSSASTVCTIKGLSELTGANLDNREIFDLAYKTVLDIQGTGSGFDVAAGIYGGTLYFVTGGKVIEPIDVQDLPMVVGYSGVKADTVTLINQVKAKAERYPDVIENVYEQIAKLVNQARGSIAKKDWQMLGDLMNFNQGYLETLGVSGSKLVAMIHAAREAGAYGAKLSGAGGGDCMFAISSEETRSQVESAITQIGGQVIKINTNVEGARIEKD